MVLYFYYVEYTAYALKRYEMCRILWIPRKLIYDHGIPHVSINTGQYFMFGNQNTHMFINQNTSCLAIRIRTCLSIRIRTCLSIRIPTCLSIRTRTCSQSEHAHVYPSEYAHVCQSEHAHVYPSEYAHVYQSEHAHVCQSEYAHVYQTDDFSIEHLTSYTLARGENKRKWTVLKYLFKTLPTISTNLTLSAF